MSTVQSASALPLPSSPVSTTTEAQVASPSPRRIEWNRQPSATIRCSGLLEMTVLVFEFPVKEFMVPWNSTINCISARSVLAALRKLGTDQREIECDAILPQLLRGEFRSSQLDIEVVSKMSIEPTLQSGKHVVLGSIPSVFENSDSDTSPTIPSAENMALSVTLETDVNSPNYGKSTYQLKNDPRIDVSTHFCLHLDILPVREDEPFAKALDIQHLISRTVYYSEDPWHCSHKVPLNWHSGGSSNRAFVVTGELYDKVLKAMQSINVDIAKSARQGDIMEGNILPFREMRFGPSFSFYSKMQTTTNWLNVEMWRRKVVAGEPELIETSIPRASERTVPESDATT
ncbi:hypothetical protein SISSUDRAFT_1051429 [Sistotremastrum suecicum HHB10207 ss-3]|uniref:Uncharacterized protein n=1 Tax=Sistotremastrum suecicum HHB10207 ss-3 TaxID=1314776 RepID=A0A166AK90_9AGAM|nr:hypothetical protein SISSUDRAFT_1051429 [Sistotremastrum suecicum HHB10207 ss-3]